MSKGEPGLLERLRERREALSMPIEAVASRSGLGRGTVERILDGQVLDTAQESLAKLAEAMGAIVKSSNAEDWRFVPEQEFTERQARLQAIRLVGLVQGNMALENAAVDSTAVAQLVDAATKFLLKGPRRRLWGA